MHASIYKSGVGLKWYGSRVQLVRSPSSQEIGGLGGFFQGGGEVILGQLNWEIGGLGDCSRGSGSYPKDNFPPPQWIGGWEGVCPRGRGRYPRKTSPLQRIGGGGGARVQGGGKLFLDNSPPGHWGGGKLPGGGGDLYCYTGNKVQNGLWDIYLVFLCIF